MRFFAGDKCLLLIQDRLVDSNKIKKAIESMFTAYLPKGASPWVYLSLEIDPAKVDVNVHPTKSDVHFLYEDEMTEAIVAAVQSTLVNANASRSFAVQTLLPGAAEPDKRGESSTRKAAPNYKVRMDPSNRTLESMFVPNDPSQLTSFTEATQEREAKRRAVVEGEEGGDEEMDQDDNGMAITGGTLWDEPKETKGREIPESLCEFTSIQELRKEAKKKGYPELEQVLAKHSYVGLVDRRLCLSLIQYSTKLFLVNHASLG